MIRRMSRISAMLVGRIARQEDSPSGLWRTLGKRVGCKPSGVRIPHPPQASGDGLSRRVVSRHFPLFAMKNRCSAVTPRFPRRGSFQVSFRNNKRAPLRLPRTPNHRTHRFTRLREPGSRRPSWHIDIARASFNRPENTRFSTVSEIRPCSHLPEIAACFTHQPSARPYDLEKSR